MKLLSLGIETLGDAVIAAALVVCLLLIAPVEWAVSGGAKAVAEARPAQEMNIPVLKPME